MSVAVVGCIFLALFVVVYGAGVVANYVMLKRDGEPLPWLLAYSLIMFGPLALWELINERRR